VKDLFTFREAKQAHRHDCHSFFLLEKGTVSIEIDFKKYSIESPSVIYMHPSQVHLILAFKDVTVCSLANSNENLNPEYLKLLENIAPTKPLPLAMDTFSIISETASMCLKFSERRNDKLYHSMLKDSCNAMGASLGMAGAAAMADALQKHDGNFELAFQDYNQDMRPFIEEVQAIAELNVRENFIPRTEEEIRKRNTETKAF